MEQDKELTMDFIRSLMKPSYTLAWVSPDDNLDGNIDAVEKCLEERSPLTLHEKADGWYEDARHHNVREIMDNLKDDCMNEGFDECTVEAFIDKYRAEISETIYGRDDSEVIGELLKNTGDIPVRIEMLSDFDCINSHWLESQGGYIYPGSYFGEMVDALNLNPVKVKRYLAGKGVTVHGRCPDRKSRDGREQVSYEDFYRELLNSCCGANLLTYIGTVRLEDLYDSGFSPVTVTVPKGNYCGIFSSIFGGGSLLDMKLRHDVTLELKTTDYHGFRMVPDNPGNRHDHSIKRVYGVCNSFFGKNVKPAAAIN